MATLDVPRIFISGATPGVGKTLLSVGLTAVLRAQGVSISTVSNSLSLSQIATLSNLTRRPCRSVFSGLLTLPQSLFCIHQAGLGSDLILLDGREGLFDGDAAGSTRGSDAELAEATATPILLVVDGSKFNTSVGALLAGYRDTLAEDLFKGSLINMVSSPLRDKLFYNAAMELFELPATLGVIPPAPLSGELPEGAFSEASRVGTIQRQFFIDLTLLIRETVDIEGVLAAARAAPAVELPIQAVTPARRRCKIGVSDDPCFRYVFRDNLDLLRLFGAELKSFSPLADSSLPREVQALYFTGGNLGEYASSVATNTYLKDAIQEFVAAGGIIYSESAGTAYLSKTFTIGDDPTVYEGVGILPADVHLKPRQKTPLGPELLFGGNFVEPSILGERGVQVTGLTLGEWQTKGEVAAVSLLERQTRGAPPVPDGYSISARHLSTFSFLHWGAAPEIASAFVDNASAITPK